VQAQGRYAEAEGLYREGARDRQGHDWRAASGLCDHLNNLAGVVEAQGRYAEAEGLYREALEIDKATIGERHPDYAAHLNNLAGVDGGAGPTCEAEGSTARRSRSTRPRLASGIRTMRST
jgi:tetratricopeptide (TPR) repeat protein